MLLVSQLFFISVLINQTSFEVLSPRASSELSPSPTLSSSPILTPPDTSQRDTLRPVSSTTASTSTSSASSSPPLSSATPIPSKPTPSSPTPSTPTETVAYQIVKDADQNQFKVQLILGGSKYTTKHCRIRKSKITTSSNLEFDEIGTCPPNGTTSAESNNKCVRTCSGEDIKLGYNQLSPRTSYVYVFVGENANNVNTDEQNKGGNVFGLATPLLVNPQFSISTEDASGKLKLAAKTCSPVACSIYYKNMKYQTGTQANECDTETDTANSVEFDLLIPHYEVRCINYPSFFYNMPNEYMRKTIDIYKPQFYLTKKSNEEKQITIKFTNAPSHEICIFRVKEATSFESNCGNKNGECYAPCKNIGLTVLTIKSVYTISIQMRHHDLAIKTDNTYDGFNQDKYVITETGDGLLSAFTSVGVTFDSSLFKAETAGTPTLSHYFADKPKPTGTTSTTTCAEGSKLSGGGNNCKTEGAKLVVNGLKAGKPYIIEVATLGISDARDFKEKIFIRTCNEKNYDAAIPTTTSTSDVSLKAVAGSIETSVTTEPTCEYFISFTGKDYFYPAECEHSSPCRGWCKDTKKIVDLEPGMQYDIKVIAHQDYGEHIYSAVQMKLATLNVTYKFNLEGFEVNAELSSNTPALCQYDIQIKMKDKFESVLMCPTPPPTSETSDPQATSAPASSEDTSSPKVPEVPSVSDAADKDAKTNPQPDKSKAEESKLETPRIARAGGITNDAPINAPDTTATANRCLEMSMCSSIMFTTGYRSRYPYKVIITAPGKSSEVTIEIPSNRIKINPTDAQKVLDVSITRDGTTLTVETAHSTKITSDSKCKWELRNSSAKSNLMEKSCMSTTPECETFPSCKSFDITGVPENNNYHLTVYLEYDDEYFGVAEINQGEKNSAKYSNQMIIIVAGIVGAVVLTLIVGSVVIKK